MSIKRNRIITAVRIQRSSNGISRLRIPIKYDEVKRWSQTFTEDFSGGIDRKKWLLRYFWGDAVLKDTYALANEKHLFTDGKNLEVAHGKLKIITRKERSRAKPGIAKWDSSPKNLITLQV